MGLAAGLLLAGAIVNGVGIRDRTGEGGSGAAAAEALAPLSVAADS
jgi:hypothetical protein